MSAQELRKPRITTRELVTMALLTGLLLAMQVALAAIPNIEVVSLLIVLYTRRFRAKTLLIIYTFALLEGLVYGFGMWFINYLYVWTVLWGLTMLLCNMQGTLGWVAMLGGFGLGFGALCSIPYLFIGGFGMMGAYFLSGIPFDLLHALGNAALAAVLFKPLDSLMTRATKAL